MSFAFPSSDVVALIQVAQEVYNHCPEAGVAHQKIRLDIRSLQSVLLSLRDELENADSGHARLDQDLAAKLANVIDNCRHIFEDLIIVFAKNEALSAKVDSTSSHKTLWYPAYIGKVVGRLSEAKSTLQGLVSVIPVLAHTASLFPIGKINENVDDVIAQSQQHENYATIVPEQSLFFVTGTTPKQQFFDNVTLHNIPGNTAQDDNSQGNASGASNTSSLTSYTNAGITRGDAGQEVTELKNVLSLRRQGLASQDPYSAERWELQKSIIRQLLFENKSYESVIYILQTEHKFYTTKRQLNWKIREWGFAKSMKDTKLRGFVQDLSQGVNDERSRIEEETLEQDAEKKEEKEEDIETRADEAERVCKVNPAGDSDGQKLAKEQSIKPGQTLLAMHDVQVISSDELGLFKGDHVWLIECNDGFDDGWYIGSHSLRGITSPPPLKVTTHAFAFDYTKPAPSQEGVASSTALMKKNNEAAAYSLSTQLERDESSVGRVALDSMSGELIGDVNKLRFARKLPLGDKLDDASVSDGTDLNEKRQLSRSRPRRSSNCSDVSQTSSLASIADSVFSLASASSMSSMVNTHGAGDRLLMLLREDPVLQPLYQEALLKVAMERLERNLRRLLKQFAVDLRGEAENSQQRGAAHFVRSRARNSAHIICGSLNSNKPRPIPMALPHISFPREAVEDVSDNSSDSDNQEDEPADLRGLEEFILASRAFAALRLKLRLFIYPEESSQVAVPQKSVKDSVPECLILEPPIIADVERASPSTLSCKWGYKFDLMISIAAFWLTLCWKELYLLVSSYNLVQWEPVIPDGKKRVRWKCNYGQSLYDDFTELTQGATHRLEERLNRRDDGSNGSMRSQLSFKSFSSTVSTSIDSLTRAFGWKEAELPKHEPQTDSNERPNSPPAPPTEPLFLLICHSEGVYAKKLLQLSIYDLKSDKKLFTLLRANYQQMRARWWTFLSFRTLVGIRFVKFELYKSSLVDIRERDAIPPPARAGPHGDYRYAPTPPDMIPPVGANHLLHLFQHPRHAEDDAVCLARFPKKLRERLAVRPGSGTDDSALTGLGWGLSLEEGWDRRRAWAVGFGIFVGGSALWGVLWTVFERSVQDAFAVAAYMVSFAVVSVGFTQAMVGG